MQSSCHELAAPEFYTFRQAVWILGVKPATVARLIRVGTLRTARRHGRLVIPAGAVQDLLGEPADFGPASGGGR